MANVVSRRKLSVAVVDRIEKIGVKKAVDELAAYLLSTGRTREANLLVRDIEAELAARGTTPATVISARPLTDDLKKAVKGMLGKGTVELREIVDESVLGGIRIELPGLAYDGTVARKLTALRGLKD